LVLFTGFVVTNVTNTDIHVACIYTLPAVKVILTASALNVVVIVLRAVSLGSK